MTNATQQPVTTVDQLDTRLATIQQTISSLANPIPIVEDIEAELDILAEDEADPEALRAISDHALTLLDAQQQQAAAFVSAMEIAQTLRQQREEARKALDGLKTAIENADVNNPQVQTLWDNITELVEEETQNYFYDMAWDHVLNRIWDDSPLDWSETNRLLDLMVGNNIESDHFLWGVLRDWMYRCEEYIKTGLTPPPDVDA